MEDDGPYEPQCKLGISICDVIIPNVHQLDLGLAKTNKKGVFMRNLTENVNHCFLIYKIKQCSYLLYTEQKRSYLPVFEEIQCYLYILKFMESHASLFSRLKEKEKVQMEEDRYETKKTM